MINRTKDQAKKDMKNYKNDQFIFDEIDVFGAEFDYEKMEIKYKVTFYDKYLKNYEGFYYDGCNVEPFKDISTSDRGNEVYFDSVQEIIDLIPNAIEYHKDTTSIIIERFISFIDEDDEIILYMAVGKRDIEI